jgi:hypothetical protein
MKQLAAILLGISAINAFAQTDTTKAPDWGWKHGMVAGLTISQIAFTDWTAGGDNSLAWTLGLDGKSVDDQEKTNWTNNYRFAFGQARLAAAGMRKTDDKIDLESILTYKLSTLINPYAALTFKSQFAPGYKYGGGPAGSDLKVSNIFDPAYITQSVGAGWQVNKEVKTRAGFALRETISDKYGFANDPKTVSYESSKVEGGLESVTDVDWKLAENILFTSRLELFAPFKTIGRVDIRNDNKLTMQVNKFITTTITAAFLNIAPYPRTQVKESIAVGFVYNIF